MIDRRGFLLRSGQACLGCAGLALTTGAALADAPRHSLAFEHLHTGEQLSTTYREANYYLPGPLNQINHLLRDWRTGDVEAIDPTLLDYLHALRQQMDSRAPFLVISGYRSPKTNATLAARSSGVAKRSLHMDGRAIDIALPGRDLSQLRNAALALQLGGVGYYPESGFIHVDTGPVRSWG